MTTFLSPSSSSSAWQYALAAHLSYLSPIQRKLFNAPADSNHFLELIRQAQGPQKYQGLVVALQPLIPPLNRLEASIASLVQMHASIASPIWAPLRLVVTLVSDRLETLQNLVVLLDRIVDPLKRLPNYEAVFTENQLLQHAVVALYCDLLEFCSRVVRQSARSSPWNVFSFFDKDLLEVSESIRHHSTEIDIVASSLDAIGAKKAREAEAVQRQLDIRKDVDRWLSPLHANNELSKHLLNYVDGSCKWLMADPAFRSTMLRSDPSFLSIIARSGRGKTTAAAFLTQHLAQSSSGLVLHFFCKASDAGRRTTLHVLRSLLWQFLQHDVNLYSTVVQWYHHSGRSVADSSHALGSMLTSCLQASTAPPIFVVIDGLNDCLDASDLLLALSNATMASNRPVKLFLFSDDRVPWPHMPPLRKETIYLTGAQCQASIDLYVKQRLTQIKALGEGQAGQYAQLISCAADGLWLFVRLVLDELQQAPNVGEVQRRMSELPSGLTNLYSSIVVYKERNFSDFELRMAQELYLWMDKSDYMPEWLRWNGYDDVLEDEMVCAILGFASANDQLFNASMVVERLASPLLEVRFTVPTSTMNQNGTTYDTAHFSIDFAHQTAKQYLRWSMSANAIEAPRSLKPQRLAPLYRGVTATWYFNQSHQFANHLQQLRQYPRDAILPTYLQMGYGLWDALKLPCLRRDLNAEEMAQAEMLAGQLCSFLSTEQCLLWIEAAIISYHAGRWNQLIENVEDVLEIPLDSFTAVSGFQRFHVARQALMTDLIYALASTWPPNDLPRRTAARVGSIPHGFYQRPLARKMINLATQYQWLLTSSTSMSSNTAWSERQI